MGCSCADELRHTRFDTKLSFLEAHKVVRAFQGGPPLEFLLAMSGTPDKLDLFIRAACAKRGRSAKVGVLPFNTLAQALRGGSDQTRPTVFALFPWDLLPEADWRSGVPIASPVEDDARSRAQEIAERIRTWKLSRVLYVPAPMPPVFADSTVDAQFALWLLTLARSIGARVLDPSAFSLASYLASGSPFASSAVDDIAESIVDAAIGETPGARKVVVTDLDNVVWAGIIGEDGVDGIACGAEGAGYRHFLYQTMLRKLKRDGVLLAAVSRNDAQLANAPFLADKTVLGEDDFVAIVASYHAKSSQISQLAEQLNLDVSSFVFIDDNPIELAEVGNALPGIRTLQFPATDEALPDFLSTLADLFRRRDVTGEDKQRTELYRRRLSSMVPVDTPGSDLTEFLRDLGMTLTVTDRSVGDRTRAVQLINKTNQFNLNGERVSDSEVGAILESGGRLYTAELTDRTGSHGEILAILMDARGAVRSFVMSCRVFQRRVELAFFAWLAGQESAPRALLFVETARNEPIRQFLQDSAFTGELRGTTTIQFDSERYRAAWAGELSLFDVKVQTR